VNRFGRSRASVVKAAKTVKEGPVGAVQSTVRFSERIESWWRNHRSNARESLLRLTVEPVQSLMTILVIAIAMALPAALIVAVSSLQQLSGNWQNSARISVFMHVDAAPDVVQRLQDTVRAMPQIEQVTYISPQAALEEFQLASGFGEALSLLGTNPLPAVLLLSPRADLINDISGLSALVDDLEQISGIDGVQLDMQWLQRMQHILEMGQRVVILVGFTLALGVLLVVGNTIRLAIESRRSEILVVKLVGGTNAFVRRPFLYTGLWYGLFGGMVAWAGVVLGGFWLASTVAVLANLYQSDFALVGLDFRGLLVMMILGGTLGLLGAALAVGRHIARIEP